MKRTALSLSAALMLSGVLVGCGTADNGAVDNNRNNDGARPIGYYNGDNDRGNNTGVNNRGGFGYNNRANQDRAYDQGIGDRNNNEGPLTDMMDPNDVNNNRMNNNNDHQRQADTITDKLTDMKHVQDASVVVTDDDVLVGVNTTDNKVTKNYKKNIRNTVQSVTGNKDIHITTDPDIYDRITDVNDNLGNGDGFNEVRSDIQGIINDLGNAAKRPFQNNSR